MENPNSGPRRRSTCRFVRRASSSRQFRRAQRSEMMSAMKNNPYIGSFRHAPASTPEFAKVKRFSVKETKVYAPTFLQAMKNSPFVGFFRHSPPTSISALGELEVCFLQILIRSVQSGGTRFSIDGRLMGGAPDGPRAQKWLGKGANVSLALRQSLQESGTASPSATVQVLSRLATWMLSSLDTGSKEPLSGDEVSRMKMLMNSDTGNENGVSDDDSDDDSVSTVGTHIALSEPNLLSHEQDETQQPPLQLSVSSLAEAYHAHRQSANDANEKRCLLRSSSSTITSHDDLDSSHRLDFVITQMDIARMTRNASRHLDVESVLSLPTVIYQDQIAQDQQNERRVLKGDREDAGLVEDSWMMVSTDPEQMNGNSSFIADDFPGVERETCVICLEQFQSGDKLRVLPCNHRFHVHCVDKWLLGSHSFDECYTSGCPTCKHSPAFSTTSLDGSLPSWAFARLGDAMASSHVVIE